MPSQARPSHTCNKLFWPAELRTHGEQCRTDVYTHLKGMHNSIANNAYNRCSLHHCQHMISCSIHDLLEPRLSLWITAAFAHSAVLLPDVGLREVPDEPTSSRSDPNKFIPATVVVNNRSGRASLGPLRRQTTTTAPVEPHSVCKRQLRWYIACINSSDSHIHDKLPTSSVTAYASIMAFFFRCFGRLA